jgi:outer membrane protein
MKRLWLLVLLPCFLRAEVHELTLKQAIDLALHQNPEVIMARLDEEKAQYGVRLAKDPFIPKVYTGSGAAYTYGYPNTIDGAAPSIIQMRTDMAVYNRSKSYALAEARETSRGAGFDAQAKTEDIVYRTATLFLDAEQAARNVELARQERESYERVRAVVASRVAEGRELELAGRRADVDLARSRQREGVLSSDQAYTEGSLAMVLGYPPGDRVRAIADDDTLAGILSKAQPESEEAAVNEAMKSSRTIRSLQSQVAAKSLEIRSQRAMRLPTINLVAQYSLFAKSTYQAYFGKFQRNNAQLGFDIEMPLLLGSASSALAAQAEADVEKLRQQVKLERDRVSLEARRAYAQLKDLQDARNLAKLDLEVSREQLSVLLAQMDEGRATSQQVDLARVEEEEKWMTYYAAERDLETARLQMLKQSGGLLAALQ